MPYLNLKGEMGKKDVTMESMSKLLKIHRNSVANKVNGDSSFSIDESIKLRNQFFPDLELEYLFKKE